VLGAETTFDPAAAPLPSLVLHRWDSRDCGGSTGIAQQGRRKVRYFTPDMCSWLFQTRMLPSGTTPDGSLTFASAATATVLYVVPLLGHLLPGKTDTANCGLLPPGGVTRELRQCLPATQDGDMTSQMYTSTDWILWTPPEAQRISQ